MSISLTRQQSAQTDRETSQRKDAYCMQDQNKEKQRTYGRKLHTYVRIEHKYHDMPACSNANYLADRAELKTKCGWECDEGVSGSGE
jgi:hypothetical protein